MNPDENVEDPARKTQECDPALVDEEGINPESAQGAELQSAKRVHRLVYEDLNSILNPKSRKLLTHL